jgi:hypothetical protein
MNLPTRYTAPLPETFFPLSWVVRGERVQQSGGGERLFFDNLTTATTFAERHKIPAPQIPVIPRVSRTGHRFRLA